MGPSKCSLAINFVIFQLEFHILCEVTKLGVILLNFVDVGEIRVRLDWQHSNEKNERYLEHLAS